MSSELTYTIQFSEEEFDQLVGDLYYYFRSLKDKIEFNDDLENEQKEYFQNQLDKVLKLQSKLENTRNKADKTNPLYILEEVNI
jgi:transcription termination factor NusB